MTYWLNQVIVLKPNHHQGPGCNCSFISVSPPRRRFCEGIKGSRLFAGGINGKPGTYLAPEKIYWNNCVLLGDKSRPLLHSVTSARSSPSAVKSWMQTWYSHSISGKCYAFVYQDQGLSSMAFRWRTLAKAWRYGVGVCAAVCTGRCVSECGPSEDRMTIKRPF